MADENPFMSLPKENPFMNLPREEQPKARTLTEDAWRGLGLTARYAVEGVGGVANIFANPLAYGANKAMEVAGIDYRFPDQNVALSQALDEAGLPKPETRGEEVVGNISRTVAGGGGVIRGAQMVSKAALGAGNLLMQRVADLTAAQPGIQGVSAVTGTVASETAKELGAGPVGQTVAGLVGGVTPSVVRTAGSAGIRGVVRGGEQGRQRMERNIDTFESATGKPPTVGQATEGHAVRAAETGAANYPGGAGRVERFANDQANGIAAKLDRMARRLTNRTTDAVVAGRAIARGISGNGGFMSRFRAEQKNLYGKLDDYIPADRRVEITNTTTKLNEMTAGVPGMPETSKHLISSELSKLYDDVLTDASMVSGGRLSLAGLRQLRTRVGEKVADIDLVSDIKKTEWKRLYGALTQDLEVAVAALDDPRATAAWTRANAHTASGHKRIEMIESAIGRKGGPEKVFQAVMSGTKEGATVLRSAMQSLDSEGKRILSATVLRRLGRATASKQNAAGDVFSTETFLTNWANLSKQAKSALFDRYGPGFRQDIDNIAAVASNLREGSGVFRNPSGTARQGYLISWLTSIGIGVGTGNVPLVGTALGTAAGANVMARSMTNPRFVKWLAQSTAAPVEQIPVQINLLAQMARDTEDEQVANDLGWIASYLTEYQKELQGEQDNGTR